MDRKRVKKEMLDTGEEFGKRVDDREKVEKGTGGFGKGWERV